MSGTAIISLDCEGRWGVADHLTPATASGLTDQRLRSAYRSITDLFAKADLSATFAFVELFTRSASRELTELVTDLSKELPYLKSAAAGLAAGEEGWVGDWALEMVDEGRHEIAFHGATHVPWCDLSRDQALREMELVAPERRQTMVFPRNQVAHLDVLAQVGCRAYRGSREFASRAQSLLSEFDLCTRSETVLDVADQRPIKLPAGVFVNWRSGPRKLVPTQITRLRARNLLEHAVTSGGVAHFWLHPENIATAPATFENLAAIVDEIVRLRDRGVIRVETQLSVLDA